MKCQLVIINNNKEYKSETYTFDEVKYKEFIATVMAHIKNGVMFDFISNDNKEHLIFPAETIKNSIVSIKLIE